MTASGCDQRQLLAGRGLQIATMAACGLWLTGCASAPPVPFSTDAAPLILAPTSDAGVQDKRARFREIYCAVLEGHGHELPDYRGCDLALTRVGVEPAGNGRAVNLGPSHRHLIALTVPGLGYDCVAPWLAPTDTVASNLRKYGYDSSVLKVDALSGSSRNARQIRDALMSMDLGTGGPRVVLVGYSKGIADLLEAIVSFPEIRSRIAAVVSAAGAVGGTPLANDAHEYQVNLFKHFPKATCDSGNGGGLESMRPQTRQAWLAHHQLPAAIHYYSLVTFPEPDQISSILRGSYDKLSRVDARNDGQVIFYDEVIPHSALIGFVNADHWAIALPIARTHDTVGSLFVTHNAYPREALTEALLRFIDEDLAIDHR